MSSHRFFTILLMIHLVTLNSEKTSFKYYSYKNYKINDDGLVTRILIRREGNLNMMKCSSICNIEGSCQMISYTNRSCLLLNSSVSSSGHVKSSNSILLEKQKRFWPFLAR